MLNECIVTLQISPDGPVLIKSGALGLGTDMCFVYTVRNGEKQVYLPGSSLKGVIRSHCEKICRTLSPKSVCDPFEKSGDWVACSNIFNPKRGVHRDYWRGPGNTSYNHYSMSCPACRMFGSLKFKGRCFIDDAYVVGKNPEPHIRDGVAINRFTGAAQGGAKYDFEVITEGTFETQLHLVNFEMWQLELLIFALSDLTQGQIRIGMGTSRGLGKIKVNIQKIEYHQLGRTPQTVSLSDISALEQDSSEKELYGFHNPRKAVVEIPNLSWDHASIRHKLEIPREILLNDISREIRGTLAAYLDKDPERTKIKEHWQPEGR